MNSTGSALAGGSTVRAVRPRRSASARLDARRQRSQTRPTRAARAAGEWRRPAFVTNGNIEETLPLAFVGTSAEGARRAVQLLRRQFAALFAGPCLLYARPDGASEPTYFEIESAHLVERGFSGTETSPGEAR